MLNILICDDLRSDAEKLEAFIRSSGFDAHPVIFASGNRLLEHVRSGAKVDACFLEIVMPEINGIVLAEKLREDGFAGEIIFLTISNDYAVESYAVNAFHYLLKPAEQNSVSDVLRKLTETRSK